MGARDKEEPLQVVEERAEAAIPKIHVPFGGPAVINVEYEQKRAGGGREGGEEEWRGGGSVCLKEQWCHF